MATPATNCTVVLRELVAARGPCIRGRTFACVTEHGASMMWVQDGCRGAFTCDGEGTGICGDKRDQRRHWCPCHKNASRGSLSAHSCRLCLAGSRVPCGALCSLAVFSLLSALLCWPLGLGSVRWVVLCVVGSRLSSDLRPASAPRRYLCPPRLLRVNTRRALGSGLRDTRFRGG